MTEPEKGTTPEGLGDISAIPVSGDAVGVRDLLIEARQLRNDVGGLKLAVEQFRPRVERAERVSVRTLMGTVVVLILIASVAFVAYRGILTDQRVDGMCPVLALAIGSADPTSRAEGPDRDRYVAALNVMRQAYTDLGCTTALVPPRTGT